MHRQLIFTVVLTVAAPPVVALERLDGYFIATDICEAFQSKNRRTNPGGIRTDVDHAYPMIGLNKPGGDYFQMRISGAPVTEDRWVHASCGLHAVVADTPTDTGPNTMPAPDPVLGAESTDNLLALSWQPAFCETRPGKDECLQLNDGLLPVTETGLSIHGLWPQPRGNDYCGVPEELVALDEAGRWSELPAPDIDADTTEALSVAMPGTASFLERHEWIKHGTCYKGAGGADEYYDDTLVLLDAINQSAIGLFLANNVGAEVQSSEIRQLFDDVFGDGAGNSVQVQCTGDGPRVLIQELRIALSGQITPEADIGKLMIDATDQSTGCPSGIIDPAGLQ
ncbi:MAG: ribonuclease T [Pseudomonadota bacterium]